MSIYIFLGLFGFFFSFLELATNKKNTNEKLILYFAYIFFSILLIILQGFRSEVGHDYLAYKKYYESIDVMNSNFEIGFKSLVFVFRKINLSYNAFQVIMSFFTGLIFYTFIYKNTKFPIFFLYIYLCIFFFPINFSQIRQQISICILMMFTLLNKKHSKLITIIGLILAATFHRTCLILVFVPLVEIAIKKKSKTFLLFLFGISICLMLYSKIILDFLISLLAKLTFLPTVILNTVYYYTERMNLANIGAGVYASFILCFIILIFSEKENKNTFYFMIAFLLDKAGFIAVVIQRFAYYFYFNKLGLTSYSNVIINKKNKGTKKILSLFLLLTYFFLVYIKYLIDVGSFIVPYKFF